MRNRHWGANPEGRSTERASGYALSRTQWLAREAKQEAKRAKKRAKVRRYTPVPEGLERARR